MTMSRGLLIVSCLLCVAMASGAENVRSLTWSELKAEGRVKNGEVLAAGEQGPTECLKVIGSEEGRESIQVLELQDPDVGPPSYAITGEVSYNEVGRQGYLEMWSYLDETTAFYTRTLGESGPMAQFQGSSDWRAFTLPFTISQGSEGPERLVLFVVLPEGGTVYLRDVKLMQYQQPLAPPAAGPEAWWTGRQAGWIGGIAGALIGLWGAIMGTLAGLGRMRRFVMRSLLGGSILGGVLLVVGLIALAAGQPWPVHYPFLLLGVILAVVPLWPLYSIRKQYQKQQPEEAEPPDTA